MRCFSCGVDKDLPQEEVYPFDDDKLTNEEPIAPLGCIECQSETVRSDYRMLVLCHNCWHRLEGENGPDMWTAQEYYEELNPLVPFDMLPKPKHVASTDGDTRNKNDFKVEEDLRKCLWHPRSYNSVDWSKVPERVTT